MIMNKSFWIDLGKEIVEAYHYYKQVKAAQKYDSPELGWYIHLYEYTMQSIKDSIKSIFIKSKPMSQDDLPF